MKNRSYGTEEDTEPRTEKFWIALIVGVFVLSIVWVVGA